MEAQLIRDERMVGVVTPSKGKKWFLAFEQVFIISALFLFTQAFFPLLQVGYLEDYTQGDRFMQSMWMGVYGITFFLIILRWKSVVSVLKKDVLLMLLLLVVLFSFWWSAAPEVTLRRSFALLGTNLFGVYMAARFTLEEQFRLIVRMFVIAIIFSLIFGLFLPKYGIMYDDRGEAWQGVYTHKNQLGRLMCLSGLIFFLLIFAKKYSRLVRWGGLFLSFLLLLLSTSKTALLIFLMLLVLFPLLRSIRWHVSMQVLAWMIGILVVGAFATVILDHAESFLDYLGRDITLTGRTELWTAVMEMIAQRPWLGYGYNGFWLGLEGESSYVWLATGWDPPHSHNGFLDVWLDIGLVGIALVVLGLISNFAKAIRFIRSTQSIESYWPLLYLLFMFFYNLTENTILRQHGFFWMIYVSLSLSLSLVAAKKKHEQRSAEK